MAWWVMPLLWTIGTVIYEALRPKPDKPPTEAPTFPTVEEGMSIPKVWGTVLLEGPMVAWYGDWSKLENKVSPLPWQSIAIGYSYYAGVHLVFCSGPIDEVVEVRFGDKIAPPTSSVVTADRTELLFNSGSLNTLFGGVLAGGGISGSLYVYHGTTTQTADDYLEAKIGQPISGYRRLCHAVIRRMYLGTDPHLQPLSLVVRACPNPLALTAGRHNIAGDANPANMLVDLLTADHASNGLGIAIGLIDTAQLVTVGNTLADEGLGMSMAVYGGEPAHETVADILRHIDAALFIEPSTGLLTVELVRDDYDPDDLLELNPDNFVLESFSRPSWDETRNVVRCPFIDRADGFTKRVASAQNLANLTIQGGEVSAEDIPLRGFSTSLNAQKGAARHLASLSYPLAACSGISDRSAWSLRPGRPVKLTWPPLGIVGMALRVTAMGEGRLDDGSIRLTLVEDIFGVQWTAYTPPAVTMWLDPLDTIPSLLDQVAANAPYEFVKLLSPGPDEQARALVMAARGVGILSGFHLYVRAPDTSWPPPRDVSVLTPSGLLNTSITPLSTTIIIDDGPDTEGLASVSEADFTAGKNLLWIDDEFIVFRTVTQGSGIVTLTGCFRGCLDTVPAAHTSGARVWFPSYGSHLENVNNPPSGDLDSTLRFQAFNSRVEVPFASSPDEVMTVNTPNRAARPLVPCKFLIVGAQYPSNIGVGTTFSISWQHRDRLASWSYDNAGATPAQEVGVTYTIKMYGESDTLIRTETGITTDNYTYSQTNEIADSGLGRLNNSLRVEVIAMRGTVQSWQLFNWTVVRA